MFLLYRTSVRRRYPGRLNLRLGAPGPTIPATALPGCRSSPAPPRARFSPSYPISGASAVPMASDCSTKAPARSPSASRLSTSRSAKLRDPAARSAMDSRTSYAITGIMTFSSKLPAAPDHAIVASYPITCAQTMSRLSAITGFTLPGMMLDPGCTAGRRSSPSPQRGPEPNHRISLAILVRATAYTRNAPLRKTTASLAACASK
jgi:hypothetical protein